MVSRDKILLLFDMDGTLTKARLEISDSFEQFLLNDIKPLATIGIVSGSDFKKVSEQMKTTEFVKNFDYVFCENGLVYYKNGELISEQSILTFFGERKLQKFINFCLGYMAKLDLPSKRGTFVEFRSGMINVCPVGRSCNLTERAEFMQFDKENKVRENFIDVLKKEFDGYGFTFALGGQISIDVFPIGWDKTYCLNHIDEGTYDEIHYFGDKTEAGGNDYEIYTHEKTIGHAVTSPEDTEMQLRKLLKLE